MAAQTTGACGMTSSSTLFRYLGRNFIINFSALMFILMGVVFVFEVVELLRRSSSYEGITFHLVLGMAALKLLHSGEILLPFGVLFGAIYTCWKMNKTHELVVIRAAGLSVWQFLSPLMLAAFLIGIAAAGAINPVSSILLSKYQQMENMHFHKNDSLVTVSTTGIWLRQPYEGGYALLHGESLNQAEWRMTDVIVYFFDDTNTFQRRIDSPEVYLKDGYWDIRDALVSDRSGSRHEDVFKIITELTSRKIEESFADPDSISFWKIPSYVGVMEEAGFPSVRLRVHFQSLLAQPLLFVAMILLAATFSLRPPRLGGTGIMIALGVGAGFFVFFMESMLGAFGISQKIPAVLAAWTPAMVCLLLGLAALLHLEDG
jgi:lipopolysaccharide export system permease protein